MDLTGACAGRMMRLLGLGAQSTSSCKDAPAARLGNEASTTCNTQSTKVSQLRCCNPSNPPPYPGAGLGGNDASTTETQEEKKGGYICHSLATVDTATVDTATGIMQEGCVHHHQGQCGV